MQTASSTVPGAEAEIRRRIRERGSITFAEFMEVALYWPRGGYYCGGHYSGESGDEGGQGRSESLPFGASGDYYTSPMAHPAFGALLAVQLYQFWLLLDRPSPFHVAELGAGNGQLSRDIIATAADLPGDFSACLKYLCLDRNPNPPSSREEDGGGDKTASSGATRLIADGAPLRNLRGCIISNELVDAFPVHQVRMDRGQLKEVYIAESPPSHKRRGAGEESPAQGEQSGRENAPLVEVLAEPSTPALAARLDGLGITLAEGQTAEINLGLESWARSVAGSLDSGFVVTIDYGRAARELYSAESRPRGTLTTYYRHVQTDAPLRNIGRQDITCQVDFTSLDLAGQAAGLTHLGYTNQRRLLQNLGLDVLRRRVTSTPLPASQGVANRAGLVALVNPEGLGDFKALVQGKGLPLTASDGAKIWGLSSSPEALELARSLPAPVLSDRHISLPQGWPATGIQELELNDLWDYPFGDA